MDRPSIASVPDVCDVVRVRGRRARGDGTPDVLLEVAHGATRARDYDALAARLRGPLPADLREFFFVNTDVGAPEVARRIAERVVDARPDRTALVVRSLVPRTFVDCNRVVDPSAAARPSQPGEMTPGLMPWIVHAEDRRLLLGRHAAYGAVVEAAVERVCAAGGTVVFAHTYAPREVDVAVDERIVARLRDAWRPENVGRLPLRPEVDLIARDPGGTLLAGEALVERTRACLARAGLRAAVNGAYPLHPSTTAWLHASRHPGRTLCFEVRRDLVVRDFTPFAEMEVDAAKVDRVAAPFAEALLGEMRPVR